MHNTPSAELWSILCEKFAVDERKFNQMIFFGPQIIRHFYFECQLNVKVAKASVFFWSSAQNYALNVYLECSYIGP